MLGALAALRSAVAEVLGGAAVHAARRALAHLGVIGDAEVDAPARASVRRGRAADRQARAFEARRRPAGGRAADRLGERRRVAHERIDARRHLARARRSIRGREPAARRHRGRARAFALASASLGDALAERRRGRAREPGCRLRVVAALITTRRAPFHGGERAGTCDVGAAGVDLRGALLGDTGAALRVASSETTVRAVVLGVDQEDAPRQREDGETEDVQAGPAAGRRPTIRRQNHVSHCPATNAAWQVAEMRSPSPPNGWI